MAQRRKEERARKAELHRLDNEDCDEEEEEEEDLTDESEEEEVKTVWFLAVSFKIKAFVYSCAHCSPLWQDVEDLLGGAEEEEGLAPTVGSPSSAMQNPDLVNTDGTLILFPGSSCSRTGWVRTLQLQDVIQAPTSRNTTPLTMC